MLNTVIYTTVSEEVEIDWGTLTTKQDPAGSCYVEDHEEGSNGFMEIILPYNSKITSSLISTRSTSLMKNDRKPLTFSKRLLTELYRKLF